MPISEVSWTVRGAKGRRSVGTLRSGGTRRLRHRASELTGCLTPRSKDEAFRGLGVRSALEDVRRINIRADGSSILLGRSRSWCDVRISGDLAVSRVHVKVAYEVISERMIIECVGWNGVSVHYMGRISKLMRGQRWRGSGHGREEVLLDVCGSRVMIAWPRTTILADTGASATASMGMLTSDSESDWSEGEREASPCWGRGNNCSGGDSSTSKAAVSGEGGCFAVFEDAEDDVIKQDTGLAHVPLNEQPDEHSGPEEENDPIVYALGAGGANLVEGMAGL